MSINVNYPFQPCRLKLISLRNCVGPDDMAHNELSHLELTVCHSVLVLTEIPVCNKG